MRKNQQTRTKKQRALTFWEKTALLITYVLAAIFIWVPYLIGRLVGEIKFLRAGIRVLHKDRLPPDLKNLIIPFNHPSVMDPFLIAGMLFGKYFSRHPFEQAPVIAAGEKLYNAPILRPLRIVMVMVDREKENKEGLSLREMKKAERPVLTCPEGTRTFKCKDWTFCEDGSTTNGGMVGPFKHGIGLLVQQTGDKVMPIAILGSHRVWPNSKRRLFPWFFCFWRLITIVVGEPINLKSDMLAEIERKCGHRAARAFIANSIRESLLKLMAEGLEAVRS